MSSFIAALVIPALLGSAVIGGVFFAFSSFVMKALARVPCSEGIATMQSINVVVINPSFLGTFVGTAVLSAGLSVLSLVNRADPSAMYFLGGGVLYFGGTFLVTAIGNIPLNDRLASFSPSEPDAVEFWQLYLDRWTMWNHVRTVAAIGATLLFTIGLIVGY